MKGIYGTKIGMTQVFEKNGRILPVTVVYIEPNLVMDNKTVEQDGYVATVLGYDTVVAKKLNKAKQGIFKKLNSEHKRTIREVRNMTGFEPGQLVKIEDLFVPGQWIDVQGTTKGHGFTGAIKRWNFKIGPMSHGAGYKHRYQGSLQTGRGGSQAQRVFKGKRMSGQYGHETRTVQNLKIVSIIPEEHLVLILGAIPGPENSTVFIRSAVKNPEKISTFDLVSLTKEKNVDSKVETKGPELTTDEKPEAK